MSDRDPPPLRPTQRLAPLRDWPAGGDPEAEPAARDELDELRSPDAATDWTGARRDFVGVAILVFVVLLVLPIIAWLVA